VANRWISIVGLLLAGLVGGGCGGGSSGPPETVTAASKAIEQLPYPIELHEAPGVHGVIIGHIHGKRGESPRFFVFVDPPPPTHLPRAPNFQGYSESLTGGSVTEHYATASVEFRKRGESRAQYRDGFTSNSKWKRRCANRLRANYAVPD
jgi:hypothetical protein